jgi:glycosyltransferase involved in cell wall biosynthesis
MPIGGAQTFLLDFIRALRDHEHTVMSLSSTVGVLIPHDLAGCAHLVTDTAIGPAAIDRLTPDILCYHWWPGLQIIPPEATQSRPYTVVFVHDGNELAPIVPGAAYVCTGVSNARMNRHLPNCTVIPSCIDTAQFALPRIPDPDGDVVFGRVSTDSARKFPPRLLGLFKSFGAPRSKLIAMDGGPLFRSLRIPSNVLLLRKGEVPVPEFLRRIDIFFYKTRRDCTENWCRVVTEAMAAGLPVVADNRGGIADQIEHAVTGFLCDNDDDFRHWCHLLYSDADLRLGVGARAREVAKERYDIAVLRARFLDLLDGLPARP